MSTVEIDTTRVVTGLRVYFHSQIPEAAVEHPVPEGIVGIRLFDAGRPHIELLDQEIAIYGRSPQGSLNPTYLIATLSVADALTLPQRLIEARKKVDEAYESVFVESEGYGVLTHRLLSRILRNPDVEVLSPEHDISFERPLPSALERVRQNILITSDSPVTNQRYAALALTPNDATLLANGILSIHSNIPFRGLGAIDIEKRFQPARVVTF